MAATAFYLNDVGNRIRIDCGEPVTGATSITLLVKKPSATTTTWTGLVVEDTTKIVYVVKAGDLNEVGTYICQPRLTLPGGFTGRGKTFSFTVLDEFT
jgi:hypothetical protein